VTDNRAAAGVAARYVDIDAELAGQRLDNFLISFLRGVPRSHVYRLVRSGQVRVNSGRVRPAYRIRAGDRIRIPPVRVHERAPVRSSAGDFDWLEQRIVFEDDSLLLLDKPAGLAVHGGSGISIGCIEALRILRPEVRALELVHRLDRETSGCLLVAKRRSTLRTLHALLRSHGIRKYYLTLASGSWPRRLTRVDHSLTKHRRGAQARVKVADDGRHSVTYFEPLVRFGQFATLLGVTLETGRTHQIRVHAAAAGHPLAGDAQYGSARFNEQLAQRGLTRMFLHAASVSFTWPDTEDDVFGVCVPMPDDLQRMLAKLRRMRQA
jgi:23S rRNA pseudouridine955/2504/2580 synthase